MASRWHWIAVIFSGLALCSRLWADSIGLLYPDVRDPYLKVFLNIADGARKQLGIPLHHQVFSRDASPEDTQRWLAANDISAAILLGSGNVGMLGADPNFPYVVGAISAQAPDTYSSISLNPAPDLLFKGLLRLKPGINTIHVVYDTERNSWEIEQAKAIAADMQLQLVVYPANNLRDAAKIFRDAQQDMDGNREALWLPLGGPARDKSILQSILETAWIKEQVVISSNLADVKRGVLFSLYPDNTGMGQELAKLLQSLQANPQMQPNTYFVRSLFSAINRRTAEHLEIHLGNQELNNYDFVYPPR